MLEKNGKKKIIRIIRTTLVIIGSIILIVGITAYLSIQNYINKFNIVSTDETQKQAPFTRAVSGDEDPNIDENGKDETTLAKSSDNTRTEAEVGTGAATKKAPDTKLDTASDAEETSVFAAESNEELKINSLGNSNSYSYGYYNNYYYGYYNRYYDGVIADVPNRAGAEGVLEPDTRQEDVEQLREEIKKNIETDTEPLENKKVQNIMLIGRDSFDSTSTDDLPSMLLLTINKAAATITATTFLRDIYLQIPGVGNDRLTAAYLVGGAELLMETLELNFKIRIDRYAIMDFDEIIGIIAGQQDLVELNNLLNLMLPKVTTNLKEDEMFALILSAPSYLEYEMQQWSIPVQGSYNQMKVDEISVLGIDFEKNIRELKKRLYLWEE